MSTEPGGSNGPRLHRTEDAPHARVVRVEPRESDPREPIRGDASLCPVNRTDSPARSGAPRCPAPAGGRGILGVGVVASLWAGAEDTAALKSPLDGHESGAASGSPPSAGPSTRRSGRSAAPEPGTSPTRRSTRSCPRLLPDPHRRSRGGHGVLRAAAAPRARAGRVAPGLRGDAGAGRLRGPPAPPFGCRIRDSGPTRRRRTTRLPQPSISQ